MKELFLLLETATRRQPRRRAGWGWRRGSKHAQARARQHLGERDQRQADERSRVVGIDARDQCNAQAFGLGAARTVVGLLAAQISLDRTRVEVAKRHAAGDDTRMELAAR